MEISGKLMVDKYFISWLSAEESDVASSSPSRRNQTLPGAELQVGPRLSCTLFEEQIILDSLAHSDLGASDQFSEARNFFLLRAVQRWSESHLQAQKIRAAVHPRHGQP
jgi:hypothetical protein